MLSPPPPICVVIYVCRHTCNTWTQFNYMCALWNDSDKDLKNGFHRLRHPEGFTDIKIFLLKLGVTRTYSKNKYFPLPSLEVKIAHLYFSYTTYSSLKDVSQTLGTERHVKDHLDGSFTIRSNMISEVNKDIFSIELTTYFLKTHNFSN